MEFVESPEYKKLREEGGFGTYFFDWIIGDQHIEIGFVDSSGGAWDERRNAIFQYDCQKFINYVTPWKGSLYYLYGAISEYATGTFYSIYICGEKV